MIYFEQNWLNEIFPQELEHPSTTLISGPGGSRKPLVGLAIAYNWLKQKGNVIFIPLQYPETNFIEISLKELYGLDINKYSEKIGYLELDLSLNDWKIKGNKVKANLLKPEVWDHSINELEKYLKGDKTLVFGSALNLLLFSPTYREKILEKIESLIQEKKKSYLFTVSTSAFGDLIKRWEDKADNLMFVHMDKEMNLLSNAERINNKKTKKQIPIPFSKKSLSQIKEIAMNSRREMIPKISNI